MSRRSDIETVAPGSAASTPGPLTWPALDGFVPGTELVAEHGVWGKAHGARTDFRWLAATDGLSERKQDWSRQLYLGPEDRPCRMFAWRSLGRDALAMTAYPSPAADATGRRDFLEKQVLVWRAAAGLPRAAAALALLARLAKLDEAVWWHEQSRVDWSDPNAMLPLGPMRPQTQGVTQDRLASWVTCALAAVRDVVPSEESLAKLYGALLAGQAPARLRGLSEPMPADAMVALLLPLSRTMTDQISVAGWLPSSRVEWARLGQHWNLVGWPSGVAVSKGGHTCPEPPEQAWLAARALLAGDPTVVPSAGLRPPEEARSSPEPFSPERVARPNPSALPSALLAASVSTRRIVDLETRRSCDAIRRDAGATGATDTTGAAEWDQWMREDWRQGTDKLIERGCWEAWRARAQRNPEGRRRTAMAWMTSAAWASSEAPIPTWTAWEAALEDLGSLAPAQIKALLSGPGGRPGWPWLAGREDQQIRSIAFRTRDPTARRLLRRGLEVEPWIGIGLALDTLVPLTDLSSENSVAGEPLDVVDALASTFDRSLMSTSATVPEPLRHRGSRSNPRDDSTDRGWRLGGHRRVIFLGIMMLVVVLLLAILGGNVLRDRSSDLESPTTGSSEEVLP